MTHSVEMALIHLVLWAFSLPVVLVLAGVFIFKLGKGWTALTATALLQLPFMLVFSDVYHHENFFPAEAAAAAWGIVFVDVMATTGFGLIAFPLLFFVIHGDRQQRTYGAIATLVAVSVASMASYPSVAKRFDLDFNVDLYGQILDPDGGGAYEVAVYFDQCTRFARNPVLTDAKGHFRIRAHCPERLALTRIGNGGGKRKRCLTRTESSNPQTGSVVEFVTRDQHRTTPHAPYWGDHHADNPYRLTCIWDAPYNHKDARGAFRNLVADGRTYSLVLVAQSRATYLRLYEDGRKGVLSFELTRMAPPEDGSPGPGRIRLRAVEGGIQPTSDRVFNLAPADGYTDEVVMDLGDLQHRSTRHFYFHTYQRQAYGVVEIDYHLQAGRHDLNVHMVRSVGTRVLVGAY